MTSQLPLYLSARECQALLTPEDVLAAIDQASAWEAEGSVRWPTPRNLNIVPDALGNHYHVKACVLEAEPVGGIRVVVHPADESSGVATRWVLLVDPKTTLPMAIVDERWNYAQRTVASAAAASRLLATEEANTLAIVGAGRLASAALEYYTRLFRLHEVRVASRRLETRTTLARAAADKYGVPVRAAEDVEQAVRGADLVLTCTNAGRALLEEPWIRPGAVVAALETAEPGRAFAEACDLLLVDSREQLHKELAAEFGPGGPDWVDGTIAEVAAGHHAGRTAPGQRVLIITQGLASQDVALAHRAYRIAVSRNVGSPLPIAVS